MGAYLLGTRTKTDRNSDNKQDNLFHKDIETIRFENDNYDKILTQLEIAQCFNISMFMSLLQFARVAFKYKSRLIYHFA